MALIVIGSLSGAPGVTTTALAVAAAWPDHWPVVLVEADASGGDLAARFGLSIHPGLADLAADLRKATGPDVLTRHAKQLDAPGRPVPVVLAPPGPVQARAAVAALASADASVWRGDTVVIADAGRLDPTGPAWNLLPRADLVVLLTAGNPDAVSRVAATLPVLRQAAGERLRLVVSGGAYPAADVADTLDTDITIALPVDDKAARVLSGQMLPGRRYPKLALPQTTAHLAGLLAAQTTPMPADYQDLVGARR